MFDDVTVPESRAMQMWHEHLEAGGRTVEDRLSFRYGWIGGRTWERTAEGTGHEEVDHHGPQAGVLHEIRQDLGPLLTVLAETIHRHQPIPDGGKWTIPLLMSCGFDGAFVVTVASQGRCTVEPSGRPAPERGEAAAHIERADGPEERYHIVTGWGPGHTYDCRCWDAPEEEEIIAEVYTLADAARIVLAFTGPDVEPRPKS